MQFLFLFIGVADAGSLLLSSILLASLSPTSFAFSARRRRRLCPCMATGERSLAAVLTENRERDAYDFQWHMRLRRSLHFAFKTHPLIW